MLVLGGLSVLAGAPLLFPAIGASAFLAFFAPRMPPSWPRNMLLGHALGAGIGTLCAAWFGVAAHGSWLADGAPFAAVLAASLALALTASGMVWLDLPHPPAGATTLIVATGLMGGPLDLAAILAAAASLSLFAHLAHRVSGEPYPLWRAGAARFEPPAIRAGVEPAALPVVEGPSTHSPISAD